MQYTIWYILGVTTSIYFIMLLLYVLKKITYKNYYFNFFRFHEIYLISTLILLVIQLNIHLLILIQQLNVPFL